MLNVASPNLKCVPLVVVGSQSYHFSGGGWGGPGVGWGGGGGARITTTSTKSYYTVVYSYCINKILLV